MDDPYHLGRFLEAQERNYDAALRELRAGAKRSHWMWYVFPQMRGLGRSETALLYDIASLDEARAYLDHPVLGNRLRECVAVLLALPEGGAEDIFGTIDALKLRSCLTLFRIAAPGEDDFVRALEKYFGGKLDPYTITLLEAAQRGA